MTNMVEKVARSMMRTTDIGEHNNVETVSLDWCGDELWSCDFEAMARAAIEAMREPTAIMQLTVGADWGRRTWAQYNEVINAALEEKK